MRSERSREELAKVYDVNKLDEISEGLANLALMNLGMTVLKDIDEIMLFPPDAAHGRTHEELNKEFHDMLSYCMNVMINVINTNGERGLIEADKSSKEFEDMFERFFKL